MRRFDRSAVFFRFMAAGALPDGDGPVNPNAAERDLQTRKNGVTFSPTQTGQGIHSSAGLRATRYSRLTEKRESLF